MNRGQARAHIARYSRLDRLSRPWSNNRVVRAALLLWFGLLVLGCTLAALGMGSIDLTGLVIYLLVGPLWVIWLVVRLLEQTSWSRRSSAFVTGGTGAQR